MLECPLAPCCEMCPGLITIQPVDVWPKSTENIYKCMKELLTNENAAHTSCVFCRVIILYTHTPSPLNITEAWEEALKEADGGKKIQAKMRSIEVTSQGGGEVLESLIHHLTVTTAEAR